MNATDGPGNRINGMLAVRNSSTEPVVTIRQTVRRQGRLPHRLRSGLTSPVTFGPE
jgi:hypothetical protein